MFFPLGPVANSSAVIIGGLAGAFLGTRIPERVRNGLIPVFGCVSMGLGIVMICEVSYVPVMALSIALGVLMGELIYLEKGIQKFSGNLKLMIERFLPNSSRETEEVFLEKFVAILVLFCVSGMGVFGSINEGMTGDSSMLFAKAILDFFTAAIFAITLGYSVSLIAVPQFLVQITLFLLAESITGFTTPEMVGDFKAVGGIIMLATGFRIAGIKIFAIANMLPALLIAMPVSYFWQNIVLKLIGWMN